MRRVLESKGIPEHVGLAYHAWAPTGPDGKVPDEQRAEWLSKIENMAVAKDYPRFFERWKGSFSRAGDCVFELVLASRLLVGHGNSSATDVGITVHHTWGVPVIPGSALKGLVAHYVDAVYGPDDPERRPWEQTGEQRRRAEYQGVTWRGRRIERGPGAVYRALFSAPDAKEDDEMRKQGFDAGACAGLVTFHDALYVPKTSAEDKPFAVDVLTVHQKGYHDSSGEIWPNDYESPNPVAFLTVRPGVRLLFALSGPPDWTALAQRLLQDALEQWGVGGKTSAGYGRFVSPQAQAGDRRPATPAPTSALPKANDRVEAVLLEERTRKGGWRARHEPTGLSGHIHNSGDVPPDAKPGDRLQLEVASANPREIMFRFPTGSSHARSDKEK